MINQRIHRDVKGMHDQMNVILVTKAGTREQWNKGVGIVWQWKIQDKYPWMETETIQWIKGNSCANTSLDIFSVLIFCSHRDGDES